MPPYVLPDLFAASGAVRTPAQWTARREEILNLFRTPLRAVAGPSRAPRLHGRRGEPARDGWRGDAAAHPYRQPPGPRSHQFDLTLFLPNTAGRAWCFPVPQQSTVSLTDPTRRRVRASGRPAAHRARLRIAAFHYGQLAPDDKDTFRTGAMALLFDEAAPAAVGLNVGAVAAWAWARAGPWTTSSPTRASTRPTSPSVGHSRGARPHSGPAPRIRGSRWSFRTNRARRCRLEPRGYGETVARITTGSRTGSPPPTRRSTTRGGAARQTSTCCWRWRRAALYVASADQDALSDPRGEFLSLAASSPCVRAMGRSAIGADAMPAPTPVRQRPARLTTSAAVHDLRPTTGPVRRLRRPRLEEDRAAISARRRCALRGVFMLRSMSSIVRGVVATGVRAGGGQQARVLRPRTPIPLYFSRRRRPRP